MKIRKVLISFVYLLFIVFSVVLYGSVSYYAEKKTSEINSNLSQVIKYEKSTNINKYKKRPSDSRAQKPNKKKRLKTKRLTIPHVNLLARDITKFWSHKNCAFYLTKKLGYELVSVACDTGYSLQNRKQFLSYLFSKGFLLKNEEYDIGNNRGLYLYKLKHRASKKLDNYLFIKLFFYDVKYLYSNHVSLLSSATLAILVEGVEREDEVFLWQYLGIPLNYGVLPFKEETKKVSRLIRNYHQELWLSLPLEAQNSQLSNNNVLYSEDLFNRNWFKFVDASLRSVGSVIGVHTFLGSVFTKNVYATRSLLKYLKKSKIKSFLDTMSSYDSVAYETSKLLSFKAYKADYRLLLNSSNAERYKIWESLLQRVKEQGFGILVVDAKDKQSFHFLKSIFSSNEELAEDVSFISKILVTKE